MKFNIRVLLPPMMLIMATLACMQDCHLTQYSIVGMVQDVDGNPIADAQMQLLDEPPDNSTPVMRTYITDEMGEFGVDSVSMFACAHVVFTISAEGYITQTLRYDLLLGQGHWQSLPDELVITLERIE